MSGKGEWQPIETAPTDGTRIIVMYRHIGTMCVFNAFYIDGGKHWGDCDDDEIGWWSYVYSEVSRTKLDGMCEPAHWMPLPDITKV